MANILNFVLIILSLQFSYTQLMVYNRALSKYSFVEFKQYKFIENAYFS